MVTNLKVKILILTALSIIVIVSQIITLKPHLQYGFSDVDWGFLSIYKMQKPYSLSQFIENFKLGGTRGGVYTHQIYYIGVQGDLFGLNFESFQKTTHFFKILATLAAIPIFWAISNSLLIVFLGTIFFAFSYSAVGTMYTVVTSSDYSAIFSLGLFIVCYWYVVKKNTKKMSLLFLSLLLLILTLFLSTERMYPLPLFICITEIFLFWGKGKLEKNTIKRIVTLLFPLLLIFVIKPIVFLSYFLQHGTEIVQRIAAGNWNLLLTPFIVLGSILVPHDYTRYFGLVKMDSFFSYIDFLLSGPLIIFTTTTIIIGALIFKKPLIFIVQTIVLTSLFTIVLYIVGNHYKDHLISIESITQALIGFYILSIAFVSFKYWTKDKNRLFIGLFAGPLFALLYILLTWLGASTYEIFGGVHRYLTMPALFISLFLGNLFALIIFRLLHLLGNFKSVKWLAFTPLILLLFFINVNVGEIKAFFNGQLKSGFGSVDQQFMRNQFLAYITDLSDQKPSLFYFDFTEDSDNGYYYDSTILGGFRSWMLWHKSINFREGLAPEPVWNDLEVLKSAISQQNGKKGFQYKRDNRKNFFELKDFYAFKLKDKKVSDIKNEILEQLGI